MAVKFTLIGTGIEGLKVGIGTVMAVDIQIITGDRCEDLALIWIEEVIKVQPR